MVAQRKKRRRGPQLLTLTQDELTWLRDRFRREAERIARLTPKERRERLPVVIMELKTKLDAASDNVACSRNDLRILQQQTANYRTMMLTRTIPAYEKRLSNPDPKTQSFYGPYLEKELQRVELLTGLLDKVEALLK